MMTTVPSAGTINVALEELLLTLFDGPELIALLSRTYGRAFVQQLPPPSVPAAHLAHQAVEALMRHGLVTAPLFERLVEARPAHLGRILEVAGLAGVTPSASSEVSPAERGSCSLRTGDKADIIVGDAPRVLGEPVEPWPALIKVVASLATLLAAGSALIGVIERQPALGQAVVARPWPWVALGALVLLALVIQMLFLFRRRS